MKNSTIVIVFCLLVAALLAPLVVMRARQGGGKISIEGETLEESVAREARNLPRMIYPEIEWTSLETGGTLVIYNFRVVTISTSQIDTLHAMNFVRDKIKAWACSGDEAAWTILSRGIHVRFIFNDKDSQQFGFVDLAPSDCGY